MASQRPTIYLHIGAMKTGTTFVQSTLIANREALADDGVLFPGGRWSEQVRAAQEVVHQDRADPRVREEARGAWDHIATEMLAHPGTSILSMEFLSFAGRRHARRVVRSLAGGDVHVVLSVRDTAAIIPAQWQTSVHNGSQVSWPGYLHAVRRATGVRARGGRLFREEALRSFLQAADIPHMLRVWAGLVPRDRLHVVTVPPPGSGPDLLWERFCAAVALDPTRFQDPPQETNASLGFASAELLRHVNHELGSQLQTDYHGTVKKYLALKVLAGRAREESRPLLDPAARTFSVGWNRRVRDAISASGARVEGDLDDLPASEHGGGSEYRAAPEQGEVLDAAAVAVTAMDTLVRRRALRRRRRGDDVPLPTGEPLDATSDRWAGDPDPVGAATREIAGLCLVAMEHRRHLRPEPGDRRRRREDVTRPAAP